MQLRSIVIGLVAVLASCSGSGSSGTGGNTGTSGASGSSAGGNPGSGGASGSSAGGDPGSGGASGSSTVGRGGNTSTGGASGSSAGSRAGNTGTGGAGTGLGGMTATGGAAGHYTTTSVDLCAGRVADLMPHTMTALAKPALGATAVDAEFGTTFRRITAVSGTGESAAIVPMYSTISAWNADESRLILYAVGKGHQLYDGKSYQLIKSLSINPPDIEQVYWDTSNPDLLYYVDGQSYIRYHVSTGTKDTLHNFSSLCGSAEPNGGGDPMFTSWDSHRLGLFCGTKMFMYDSSTDTVFGPVTASGNNPPGQVAPSGNLLFLSEGTGQVLDTTLKTVRSLGLQDPANHASLGQLANGHDTWNGAIFDDGNDDAKSNVGVLATFDLTTGTGSAIIGPKTGYPYPPSAHISAMAYRQPGWVFVSTYFANGFEGTGTPPPSGLLDMENLIADTNTGKVCRVGRHRAWGGANQVLGYWAEAHTTPSPTGTRAIFASDWTGGSSVDTYVLELPAYKP